MLQQRVSDDLPHLTDHYLELSSEKGPGILVVNYYPEPDPDEPELDPELELGIQSETRFLKPSQIPQFMKESGLEELPADFATHDPQTEFDSPWKDVIERYFEDFIQFFLPQAYGEIEWSRGFEFLAQETRPDAQRRLASKLAITRRLYDRGDSREDVINLFGFIDWVMSLPVALE